MIRIIIHEAKMHSPNQPSNQTKLLYTYVPEDAVDSIRKHGLYGSVALLTHPDLLALVAKGRGWRQKELEDSIKGRLNTFRANTLRGPNFVFHRIPKSIKLSDQHPNNQRKLIAIALDLERLMQEQPDTKIYGLELSASTTNKPGEHRYISDKDMESYFSLSPEEYWSTYSDPENIGFYAKNVPHVSVHTPSGYIEPRYLIFGDQ